MAKSSTAKIRGREKTARPGRGMPMAGASARGAVRVGIELDAGVAHIVSVTPDGSVSYHRLEQANNANALSEVLKSFGRNDSIQVALTSDHQSVRQLAIPNVPQHALPMALRTAAAEHMPMASGGIAVAGLQVPNPELDAGRTMTVAAVSAADATPLMRQLGNSRPITVSSFLLPADGLYLRVARATAELILVRDGAPAAVRTLRSGGVQNLVTNMSNQSSTVYLGTESTSSNVDTYVDEVVGDVRRTIVFWRREGMNVPDQLTIIGEGAALHQLDARLRDASYEIMPVPAPQGLSFSGVRMEDRPVAFQALAAALMDMRSQPYAPLIDESITEPEVTESSNAVPKLVALLVAVIAIGMLGFGYFSMTNAKNEASDLKSRETAAQKQLTALAKYTKLQNDVNVGKAQVGALRDADPLMGVIFEKMLQAAPPGTTFKSIDMARSGTRVNGQVDASTPGNADAAGFRPVGVWQDNFLKLQKTSAPAPTPDQVKQGTVPKPALDAWPATILRQDSGMADVKFAFSVDAKAFKGAVK